MGMQIGYNAASFYQREPTMPRFNRLLITGAAGNLGRELRRGLMPLATTLRITDRVDMQAFGDHEEVMPCELGDFDAVSRVVEGCDAIVHFGAAPVERPWEEVLESSIKGGYNVYEAARRHGIRRIVYASSIHAVGYERREAGAGRVLAVEPVHHLLCRPRGRRALAGPGGQAGARGRRAACGRGGASRQGPPVPPQSQGSRM